MSLFLVFSVPVAWLFLLTSELNPENSRGNIAFFRKGALFFLPIAGLWWFIWNLVPYVPGSFLYLFRPWFNDFFFFPLAGILGFRLFSAWDARKSSRFEERLAFLTGMLCLSGLVTLIEGYAEPDVYHLFALPLLRIALILTVSRLVDEGADETGFRMIVFYGLAILSTFACALVALLFHMSHPWFAILLTIILCGFSIRYWTSFRH